MLQPLNINDPNLNYELIWENLNYELTKKSNTMNLYTITKHEQEERERATVIKALYRGTRVAKHGKR